MEPSDKNLINPSGTRAISDIGVIWDNSQESLDQSPSSSQVCSDGVETMKSENEKTMRKSSPARKRLMQKIRDDAPCLNELPDDLLERILDEQSGLDDVYELAAARQYSKRTLKCLLHLRMERTEALGCSVCKRMYFNHIHYLLHISSEFHATMVAQAPMMMDMKNYVMWKNMLELFSNDIESWNTGDSLYVNGEKYYKTLNEDDSTICRPTKKWLRFIYPMIRQQSQKTWTSEAKENILLAFEKHLEEGSPTCRFCEEAFDNVDDYYRHCSTFSHLECVHRLRDGDDEEDLAIQMLTLLLNGNVRCVEYFDFARIRNNDDPDSLNYIYESSAAIRNHLPPFHTSRKRRTELGREREMHLLERMKPSLNERKYSDLKNMSQGANLRKLVEPSLVSFSTLARRISQSSVEKDPLGYFERIEEYELFVMYKVAIYTLEKGLPFCLHCDQLFENSVNYCNHLMTKTHHENFSSFSSSRDDEGTTIEDIHEMVQMLILESSKRHQMEVLFDGEASSHPINLLPLVKSTNPHFYCDVCCRPFVSFTFYIAHYWSFSHLANDPMPSRVQYPPEYVSLLIRHSTKDQQSRISQEILDKYASVDTPFVPDIGNFGVYTRDAYLTYYVHFHFEKKYVQWRERQSYQRDKGTPTVFDDKRHVPEKQVLIQVDEMMRALHKRAPYEWWNNTNFVEYNRFRNYFFTFPPTLIWKELYDHVNTKGKIPFCFQCKVEFRSIDDYFLHFGMAEHPNPTSMDDAMAGLALLIHIMYSENAVGNDLDQFHNVVSF